ncbi:MAG: ABC transporter permease [Gemmatimonadaceae bacterium]
MTRYKLRTSFMMLGSLIGVAALTFVLSIGQGAQAKVLKTVRQILGDEAILVMGGGGQMMGGPRAGASRLTLDDISAVAQAVPDVADWDPQVSRSSTVRHGASTATVRVVGGSERWERVWGRTVARGQSLDASSVSGAARVALVGETVVRTLFAGEDPIDAEIRIGAVPFKVIGVLETFGTDLHGMDRDNEIVVPISTMMRRIANVDAISVAKLSLKGTAPEEETAQEIARVLRARHALDKGQPDDFRTITAVEVKRMVGLVRRVLLLYVPLVGAVALLVGGIVAATLMLASVSERVGEIGLRRAVGARPEDIRRQFAAETAGTIILGGVGGVVLGYIGVLAAASRMQLGPTFSWSAVLISLAASALTGFLAGVAPARRAARLQPADALR